MYKKKKEAQREKPDKQAKRPGTGKQEDSLVSHYNRGTRHPRPPRQFVEIYWEGLVRANPNLSAATPAWGPKRSGTGFQLIRARDHLFHHEEKTDFPGKRKERMPNRLAQNTRRRGQ